MDVVGERTQRGIFVREKIKKAGEVLLVRTGLCRVFRELTGRSVILAYHNVVPSGKPAVGDTSLHLGFDVFKQQIDRLEETHEIVPLRALLTAPRRDRAGYAAITFDDAYRGAIRLGLEELDTRDLAATVFVSPGLLGDKPLWWDVLADSQGRLEENRRSRVMNDLQGKQKEALRWAAENGLTESASVPSYARTAHHDELLEATAHHHVQLEAHTWRHPNLARLSRPEIEREYEKTVRWFDEYQSDPKPLLAYPYGRVSDEAEKMARRFFSGALVATGSAFRPDSLPNRYRIPRVNVAADVSIRGFELRASGIIS